MVVVLPTTGNGNRFLTYLSEVEQRKGILQRLHEHEHRLHESLIGTEKEASIHCGIRQVIDSEWAIDSIITLKSMGDTSTPLREKERLFLVKLKQSALAAMVALCAGPVFETKGASTPQGYIFRLFDLVLSGPHIQPRQLVHNALVTLLKTQGADSDDIVSNVMVNFSSKSCHHATNCCLHLLSCHKTTLEHAKQC